jgi:transposase
MEVSDCEAIMEACRALPRGKAAKRLGISRSSLYRAIDAMRLVGWVVPDSPGREPTGKGVAPPPPAVQS